ncbi:MAG: UDP-N-acetylmuramate dehydrogenase [Firmicutes bacterium]|nr:UDP-N-acetylmuramate dehydrogenase [Bacillota bacterium]
MQSVAHEIAANITGKVKLQEPLKYHTSFKIGGPADLYVQVQNVRELVYVLSLLQQNGIPWFILGNGTNLLVHDEGYRGSVIHLSGKFKDFKFNGLMLEAGAAVPLAVLARRANSLGLSGLTFAGGIPGTVGGAVVMNAGAHGHCLSEVLVDVQILDSSLELHTCQASELGLNYRKSKISSSEIICFVRFQLEAGDKVELERQSRDYLMFRHNRQPRQPNAGSIFKNPPDTAAGSLIEAAGLKGYRVGGAMISDIHANFIVNCQQATAQDVMTLINIVRRKVAQQFGIELELEVRLLGY